MTTRITYEVIAARVAECRHRLTFDKHRPVAFAQGETSRGEPRHNYVCCQQKQGMIYHGSGGDACRCAGDCPSQKAAELRAAYVVDAREQERTKAVKAQQEHET